MVLNLNIRALRDIKMCVPKLHEYTKYYLKWMNCIICEQNLNKDFFFKCWHPFLPLDILNLSCLRKDSGTPVILMCSQRIKPLLNLFYSSKNTYYHSPFLGFILANEVFESKTVSVSSFVQVDYRSSRLIL